MDEQRFDRLAQALAGSKSRRSVIAAAAAGVFASAFGRGSASAQSDCPAGYAFCEGICRFLENDYNHCGECGNSCGDAACIDSACAPCETIGQTTCWDPIGETNYCADLTTSWIDCGECGNRCTTGPCENGICVSTADCDEGLTECMGQCVDLQTSVYHCGACGNACMGVPPEGQSSIGVCIEGGCQIVCNEGWTACPGDPVDFCAFLGTDNDNCGQCGLVCEPGSTCVKGVCENPDETTGGTIEESDREFSGLPDALAFALRVEDVSLALFRQGLAQLPSESFTELPGDTRTRIGKLRDHDKAHVELLEALIAGTQTSPERIATPTFTFTGPDDLLERAHQLKELTTAAYALLIPSLGDPAITADMVGIAIVEGRHAAWLATRTGNLAFDEPTTAVMSRAEIEEGLAAL
jgi:hypothetical protein